MIEKQLDIQYSYNTLNGNVGIRKVDVFIEDGVEISRSKPWRCVVDKGDVGALQAHLPQEDVDFIVNVKWAE
jgi:hypothetical protein